MNVGWVIVWQPSTGVLRYLARTGFRLDYSAAGCWCTGLPPTSRRERRGRAQGANGGAGLTA